jgi:hypothetical protein
MTHTLTFYSRKEINEWLSWTNVTAIVCIEWNKNQAMYYLTWKGE